MECISVIVPVFNVEKYLVKCLNSIMNQTYKQLEIILVDDGSTDGSGAICDAYAQKDNRIKVIHQKNGGLASARNAGLDMAKGQYITFVDSDDYIAENMYEILYKQLSATDAEVIICGYQKVDEEGKTIPNISPVRKEELDVHSVLKKINEKNGWYYLTVWNKMYRKCVWEKLRFDVGKKHEDEFIAHKVFVRCKRILSIENRLYFYRSRVNSIMTQKADISRLDGLEAVYNRYLFYQKQSWNDLLLGTFQMARNSIEILKNIDKKSEGYSQRKKEALQMYRYMFWNTKGNKTIKNYIVAAFPNAYFAVKGKLQNFT